MTLVARSATPERKKMPLFLLLTLPDAARFSKFFH